MPLKSSISLLVHLLLVGWMGSFISAYSLGARHEGQDTESNKLYEFTTSEVRKPRSEGNSIKGRSRILYMSTFPQKTTEIQENENYVLECKAGGHPLPVITWLKDGVQIEQGNFWTSNGIQDTDAIPSGLGATVSRLFINCMRPEDVGEYTCVATTPYQRVTYDTSVFIIPPYLSTESNPSCQRRSALIQGSIPQTPRIYLFTTEILQVMGKDVLLLCRTLGDPSPSVKWLKNEEHPVANDARHTVLKNGDLLIRNLKWNDMGLYTCEVENSQGSDNVSTFLYPMKSGK